MPPRAGACTGATHATIHADGAPARSLGEQRTRSAPDGAGPGVEHSAVEAAGANPDQDEHPRMLYYFRPLQTKRLEETILQFRAA